MRKLYPTGADLDRLENMPIRESRAAYLTRKYVNMYNIDKFDHPWYRHLVYNKMCDRILQNNIGKSFAMAFSYYCSKAPFQYQYTFLDEFADRSRWNPDYSIDSDGLIVYNPSRLSWYKYRPVKDYRYYRDKAEKASKERKIKREQKLAQKNKDYNFKHEIYSTRTNTIHRQ